MDLSALVKCSITWEGRRWKCSKLLWDFLGFFERVKQTFAKSMHNEVFPKPKPILLSSSSRKSLFSFNFHSFKINQQRPKPNTIDTRHESMFSTLSSLEIQFHANWINKLQVDFAVFVDYYRSEKVSNLKMKNGWIVNWKLNSSTDYCLMWFYYFLGFVWSFWL